MVERPAAMYYIATSMFVLSFVAVTTWSYTRPVLAIFQNEFTRPFRSLAHSVASQGLPTNAGYAPKLCNRLAMLMRRFSISFQNYTLLDHST